MLSLALVVAAAALPQVFAHGGVLSYTIDGTTYKGFAPYNSPSGQVTIQRRWDSHNPIQGATDATLSCNNDGSSLASGAQLTATVSAGTAITANWNNIWPHEQGPQVTYLARCPGTTCDGVNSKTLKWFKIDEAGLLSGTVANGQWGAGKMVKQGSTWTSTIPKSVPSGPYLIRFETIALHLLPAQFYPECAQLNIINGGSLEPTSSELVTFPGGYSDSDPGLSVVLYSSAAQTQTTYKVPGPPLYAGVNGGGSSPQPSTVGTTAKPSSSSSTKPVTTIAPSSTTKVVTTSPTSSAAGPLASAYAQCGGKGWTGATSCSSGYTCKASGDYYSQCLP